METTVDGILGREIVIPWAAECVEETEAGTQRPLAEGGPFCSIYYMASKGKVMIFFPQLSLRG